MKSSFPCNLPRTILGDTDILKDSPEVMILAGFGDIIGKYSALTDWRLSQIVNGEYFCEMTAKITQDVLDKCVAGIDAMNRREPEAIKDVMEGSFTARNQSRHYQHNRRQTLRDLSARKS